MKKCEKCGKEFNIGMFSLISNMCDDCYEKVNFYTPDFDYVKEYIMREFALPDKQYSLIDLMVFFDDCEHEVFNKIKAMHIENKKHFVTVFREFEIKDKMNEIIRSRHVELKYSYYFGDTKYDTIASFEDRKKYRSVIIR